VKYEGDMPRRATCYKNQIYMSGMMKPLFNDDEITRKENRKQNTEYR
jgi:hypothetical protein